jgi:hypothetical protein
MDHQQSEGDAIWGVEGFVVELFGRQLSEEERKKRLRQVNHALKTGGLPGRKANKFWIGSKSVLRRFIAGEGA